MRYVYIVRCNDNSLYTGITNDIEKRIDDHNTAKNWAKYTKARRPVILVWSQEVNDKSIASKLECKIKKMTKNEKEKMINYWNNKKFSW